jgi:hypothetical protein
LAHRGSARLSPREGRSFAWTLAGAFGALAALLWWRGRLTAAGVLGGVAAAFLVAGVAVPGRLGPVRAAWMGMAHAISRVTTPVFMSAVYFLVITPTALLRRLFGGNPLRRRGGGESGWVDRRDAPPTDLTRQF